LQTIKAIAEREKQPIYLLAPNDHKSRILLQEIGNLGLKDIFVDYYRSDHSLRVERSERICITVGMAEIPANACDALAWGKDNEEKWIYSRALRLQAVHSATWQAVNRVRDPEGIVESKVYFIGCRLDQIRQTAKWGTDRTLGLKEIKKTMGSKGETIKRPLFEVQVSQEIEVPRIYGEGKNSTNSERRSVKDYIERIELYDDNSINSGNHCISSIDISSRENAAKVGIYNFPKNEIELDSTSNALHFVFVNRTDCHARQGQNSKTGKWEFYKYNSPPTVENFKRHVSGEITLGLYEIGLDDTVTWCCDDVDSHHGETDAREKVTRLVSTCRSYEVPFLLEASGSVDSYHFWIFISRTSTYNAHRFIRQINSEANVNCEAFPKQKSLYSKDAKYGNLLKLPVCYHNRSKSRSAFLDADTFEPLEGPIFHPGLVHLLEIPDLSESSSEGMPKVSTKQESRGRRSPTFGNTLRYCMQRALEDCLSLTGTGGHHFRMAIACEGRAIGMTAESVTQLFQKQRDFKYEISLKKSREPWDYDYSSWSCKKIQDQCGSIVKGYCRSCPFNHAKGEKVSA
jgi:hypothetical protein